MVPNLLCQTDKYSSARPREDSLRTRFESFDFRYQCMRVLEKTSGPVGDSETRTTMVSLAIPIVEFGSYDPGIAAFIPMQSLGSINETSCVVGFDQTSFKSGKSQTVVQTDTLRAARWSRASYDLPTASGPNKLQFSARVQKIIPQSNNVRLDGGIVPNAFHGRAGFSEAHEKLLTLADGGLDGANIPLQPLLVKARGIRAIIAHDATADKEDNLADGTAMIAESRRRATRGRVRFFLVADLFMYVWGCWGQEIPEFHRVHPDGDCNSGHPWASAVFLCGGPVDGRVGMLGTRDPGIPSGAS
ncbi:hypothetical protein B0H14DRAFT_2626080 [Mycena olivaceomarginata]|nr:hypothetical protein B0H14DRAFT_2626080 [Mycena olivaceomarginata]